MADKKPAAPTEMSVPIELVQAVVDYLAARPYREVAHLIGGLQQSASRQSDPAPAAS